MQNATGIDRWRRGEQCCVTHVAHGVGQYGLGDFVGGAGLEGRHPAIYGLRAAVFVYRRGIGGGEARRVVNADELHGGGGWRAGITAVADHKSDGPRWSHGQRGGGVVIGDGTQRRLVLGECGRTGERQYSGTGVVSGGDGSVGGDHGRAHRQGFLAGIQQIGQGDGGGGQVQAVWIGNGQVRGIDNRHRAAVLDEGGRKIETRGGSVEIEYRLGMDGAIDRDGEGLLRAQAGNTAVDYPQDDGMIAEMGDAWRAA